MGLPLPVLLAPWLLAVAAWLLAPWMARRGVPDRLARWTPSALALVGIALMGLSLAGDPTPLSGLANPVRATTASVDAGRQLFGAHCAECHGADARGGGPTGRTTEVPPPSLVSGHLSFHTDGDIYYWISNGLPGGMPAWQGRLTEHDRWNLVNYLRALNEGTTVADVDLLQASVGVCAARKALPAEPAAAMAAFTNQAHTALHLLAAQPDLDRALAGRLLEAKTQVESDIANSANAETLQADLESLQETTDAALRDINREAPACDID